MRRPAGDEQVGQRTLHVVGGRLQGLGEPVGAQQQRQGVPAATGEASGAGVGPAAAAARLALGEGGASSAAAAAPVAAATLESGATAAVAPAGARQRQQPTVLACARPASPVPRNGIPAPLLRAAKRPRTRKSKAARFAEPGVIQGYQKDFPWLEACDSRFFCAVCRLARSTPGCNFAGVTKSAFATVGSIDTQVCARGRCPLLRVWPFVCGHQVCWPVSSIPSAPLLSAAAERTGGAWAERRAQEGSAQDRQPPRQAALDCRSSGAARGGAGDSSAAVAAHPGCSPGARGTH